MKTLLDEFNTCLRGAWTTVGIDVQYKTEVVDNILYVYFQCTKSNTDWGQNLKFWLKSYKLNGKRLWGHAGYIENWESAKDQVLEDIRLKMSVYLNVAQIVLVGYSQGACIATLCYQYLKSKNFHSIRCDVFGSPNVLWMQKNDGFDTLDNYKVMDDLFTMVPFKFLGFREAGNVIMLGEKKCRPSVYWHVPSEYRQGLESLQLSKEA